MKTNIRLFLLAAVCFMSGFLFHAFFFPDYMPSVQNILAKNAQGRLPLNAEKNESGLVTYIDYDGKIFSPNRVIIKKGFYIAITNKSSDTLMWLVSDYPDLNSKRGYGESERLERIMYLPGTYTVTDSMNTNAKLILIIR